MPLRANLTTRALAARFGASQSPLIACFIVWCWYSLSPCDPPPTHHRRILAKPSDDPEKPPNPRVERW